MADSNEIRDSDSNDADLDDFSVGTSDEYVPEKTVFSDDDGHSEIENNDNVKKRRRAPANTSKREKSTQNEDEDEDEDDMTKEEVRECIDEELLIPGPPPDERNCTAKAWQEEYGMRFLFWKENNIEFENWYYCQICKWLAKVNLSGGTSVIRRHAELHVYSLPKNHFAALLAKATSFGDIHGAVSKRSFIDHLPDSKKW